MVYVCVCVCKYTTKYILLKKLVYFLIKNIKFFSTIYPTIYSLF